MDTSLKVFLYGTGLLLAIAGWLLLIVSVPQPYSLALGLVPATAWLYYTVWMVVKK